MIADVVRERLEAALTGADVQVDGDASRMTIVVVSDHFEGVARVKKQQLVYAAINDLIAAGELHAVTIRALTPGESVDGTRGTH